ncbi:MAG: hypothetical protein JJE36_05405 [Coriobacteriia bacterium]|nr:hypothetical protein [Coriobacteriia bacterium]
MAVKPDKLSPGRKVAYEVVRKVHAGDSFAHETLSQQLKYAKLDARDAAYATRLSYGVISYDGTLDEILSRLCEKPNHIKPKVRDALKIALYEIFIEEKRDYAAVDQGVELVKSVHPHSSGLANAILRSAIKLSSDFPFGDPATDVEALARAYGFPLWLTKRFVDQFGMSRTETVLAAFNQAPPFYLAVPSWYGEVDTAITALEKEGVVVSLLDPLLPRALKVSNPAIAVAGELVGTRRLFTIDAAAQLVVKLCDARAEETIVEIGSGRGTKTLLLASEARLSGSAAARVIGIDSFEYKSMITLEQALRYGLSEVSVQTVDARDADALIEAVGGSNVADTVLIDAPCSGIGTLRRHVDKRWRLSESDIAALAEISMELLMAASHLVKPKGKIIFATCTMAKEENAEVVQKFLESPQGSSFEIEQIRASELPESWESFITEEGFFQSIPLDDGPDGHFIARIKRG